MVFGNVKKSVLGVFNKEEESPPRLNVWKKMKKGKRALKWKAAIVWEYFFDYEAAFRKLQLEMVRDELKKNLKSPSEQIKMLRMEIIRKQKETFPDFATLPPELMLKIVKKCQAIPYVRLRQSCRGVNKFCETNRRHLGVYIYRKHPHLFLLTSMKNTYPFYKQITNDEEEDNTPYVVVDYGRLHGEATLKMPLNRETLSRFRDSISGFHFPDISILNYNDPEDKEGNEKFKEALDCFIQILPDLHAVTLNVGGLTKEQYDRVTSKLDLDCLRLVKSKINEELIETKLAMDIDWFNCCFPSPPELRDIRALLKTKAIATISFGRYANFFGWSSMEQILKDYKTELPEFYSYLFSFDDDLNIYTMDLTSKEGSFLPTDGLHIGPLKLKEIPNAVVECPYNLEKKEDYWFSQIGPNRWMLTKVTRKQWLFSTGVIIGLIAINGNGRLNTAFLKITEDILLNGDAMDQSEIYEKLEEAETLEDKKQAVLNYLEYVPSRYL